MSEDVHKSHNVSKLMYHFVFPTKYRKVVIDEEVDLVIKETCIEIEKRYEINFVEIGTYKDHVHFLIQSVLGQRLYLCPEIFGQPEISHMQL